MSTSIYIATPEQEQRRLREFGWPNAVSIGILRALSFRTLLDVGCGSSPTMADLVVNDFKGLYCGVDSGFAADGKPLTVKLQAYLNQAGMGGDIATARHANVTELPLNEKFDVVHTRFLLMHAAANQHADLIRHAIALASGSAVFMEYDWTPMLAATEPEALIQFVGAARMFAGQARINLQMGAMLPNHFIGCEFETEVARFSRPKADYTGELIQLCETMLAVCSANNWKMTAKRVHLAQEALQHQANEFVSADIVAVIVRK